MKTNRGLLKFILLAPLTLGIYPLIVLCGISGDLNTIAKPTDGKDTMNWIIAQLLGCVTFGILPLIWWHTTCERIGTQLNKRGIGYSFGAGSFWIFDVLLAWTVICPLIFMHKFFKSMNLISESYNNIGPVA